MNQSFPGEDSAKNAVRVWSLAKSITVGMMTIRTTAGEGQPEFADGLSARPMRALFEDGTKAIWFIVPRTKAPTQPVETLLTFSNGLAGDHVALYGTTSAVDDRAKLKVLWNGHAGIAFPKGPGDMNAILLKFEPNHASFWEGGADALSFVVHFLEAKMTGKAPEVWKHGVVHQ